MANTFKNIEPNDVISTRTLLHEAIPLTGTIVSGTYGTTNKLLGDEENIKNFSQLYNSLMKTFLESTSTEKKKNNFRVFKRRMEIYRDIFKNK